MMILALDLLGLCALLSVFVVAACVSAMNGDQREGAIAAGRSAAELGEERVDDHRADGKHEHA